VRASVLIPTRNRPELLRKAVASVLSQSNTGFELVIVNDGHGPLPDFTDRRIRTLHSGGAGAVPARNLAVGAAAGDVLAWLDDDDCWTDQAFLDDAVNAIDAGADFVFGNGRLVFADGRPAQAYARNADGASLQHDNTILMSAIAYRADLHRELGAFDETLPFYCDWDWYLRVARSGAKFCHLSRPVVDVLIHARNTSGGSNPAPRRENLDRLSRKHGIGPLPLKTHLDLA
jgi:glycosyltransferase involved in cell wall biosynthesis